MIKQGKENNSNLLSLLGIPLLLITYIFIIYQPHVPVSPLNGPTISEVIHPP